MNVGTLAARARVGAIAGAAAGIAAGVGARISMRMLADGFPEDGFPDQISESTTFTVMGTAFILIFGALIGAPAGVLYEAIADRIPGPRIARGLIFSALCLALVTPLLLSEGAELLFRIPRVIVLVLPFLLYGATLGLARKQRAA